MVESENHQERDCDKIIFDETRGRLEFHFGMILRRPFLFLKIMSPLLTAHHPFCTEFSEHTISFRGRQWCMGCFFNTFAFLIAIASLLFLWLLHPLFFDRFWLFYGGLSGLVLYFFIGLSGIDRNRKIRIGKKFILGFAFAMVSLSIIIAGGSIDYMLHEKILLVYGLYMAFIMVLIVKRALEMVRTCENCEYNMRWSRCPGFKDIVCKNIEAGFIHVAAVRKKEKSC